MATFALTLSCVSFAQEPSVGIEMSASKELLAGRMDKQWLVPVAESGTTRIPRVCASVRAAFFEGMPDKSVIVHPEIEYWELRFEGQPASKTIVLQFDSFPSLPSEVSPTKQAGDRTITLRCSRGITQGEKLRFEPQPHKNTIGYWTIAKDSVSWPIQISKPGSFNVGMLQGAGDNGGGTARVSVLKDGDVIDSFEFKVEVTGHFQNFRWRHAGTLQISAPGKYELKIQPVKIDDVALMDVRQVHLSPQP